MKKIYPYILIVIISIAPYIMTVSFDLVKCDDWDIIVRDYSKIDDISEIPDQLFKGYINTDYYRPAMNISFILNAAVGGKGPFVYHLTNLLLHGVFCMILFAFLKKLDFPEIVSLILAAIFAVHPITANSVSWIVGRNDILLSIFAVSSFILLLKNLEVFNPLWFILHLLFLFLAMLTKETGLVFPAVMLVFMLFNKKNKLDKNQYVKYLGSWAALIGLWLVLRANSELGHNINFSGFDRLIYNLQVLPEFFAKFFLPVDLSVLSVYNSFNTIAGIIIMVLIAVLVYIRRSDIQKIIKPLLWAVVLIAPGMWVSLYNYNFWNEYLECRFYLPAVGLVMLIGSLIQASWFTERKKQIFISAGVIIPLLGVMAFSESFNYKDPVAYYNSAIEDNSKRPMFYKALYVHYEYTGDHDMAEKTLKRSIEAYPEFSDNYYALAKHYYKHKRFEDAEKYLKISIEKNSDYQLAWVNLASLYLEMQNLPEAAKINALALNKWPYDKNLIKNAIYINMYRNDNIKVYELVAKYADIVKKEGADNPKLSMDLANYGLSFADKKMYENAVTYWNLAIKLNFTNQKPYEYLLKYYLDVAKDAEKAKQTIMAIQDIGGTFSKENFDMIANKLQELEANGKQ